MGVRFLPVLVTLAVAGLIGSIRPAMAPAVTFEFTGTIVASHPYAMGGGQDQPVVSILHGSEATGETSRETTGFLDLSWEQPLKSPQFLVPESGGLAAMAQVNPKPVPLPAAVILFGSGLGGIVGIVVRRQGVLARQDLGSGSVSRPTDVTRAIVTHSAMVDEEGRGDRLFGLGCPSDSRYRAASGLRAVMVVSGDPIFAANIADQLRHAGYRCGVVPTVQTLLDIGSQQSPALVLVDRRIGDWDMLRTERMLSHIPIVTLIPQGESVKDEDVIDDLERGADGVFACRDGHRLLLAVIGTYLRRAGHDLSRRGLYRVGDIQLDTDRHELTMNGEAIPLSAKQFAILQTFMSAPFKVFTRSELVDLVWGPGFAIGEHTLDVHIHALRRLLRRDSEQRCRLIAIKGVGFKLQVVPRVAAPSCQRGECPAELALQTNRGTGSEPIPVAASMARTMAPRRRTLRGHRPPRRSSRPSLRGSANGRFEYVTGLAGRS